MPGNRKTTTKKMQLCKCVSFLEIPSTLNAPLQGKLFIHPGDTSIHLGTFGKASELRTRRTEGTFVKMLVGVTKSPHHNQLDFTEKGVLYVKVQRSRRADWSAAGEKATGTQITREALQSNRSTAG